MKTYTTNEIIDLLEKAQKLNLQLYSQNTLEEVEVLINQELLKFTGKPEKWE